jgi:hypothetical protein
MRGPGQSYFLCTRTPAGARHNRGMNTTSPRRRPRCRQDTAVRRLLSALDRMIAAAHQAEGARRDLARLRVPRHLERRPRVPEGRRDG